jgi:hypothetical protein
VNNQAVRTETRPRAVSPSISSLGRIEMGNTSAAWAKVRQFADALGVGWASLAQP